MVRIWLGLALVLVAAGAWNRASAEAPQTDLIAEEKARLAGIWEMAENVVNGASASERQMRSWLLVIEGDQYNPGSGETSIEYVYRIDPSLTPKAIDLAPLRSGERGRAYRGVYTLDGDTLVICRPLDPEDDRPAGFGARAGSGLARVVWKRRKSP
jgi:uncharacterized protein (TIGR03067 family)